MNYLSFQQNVFPDRGTVYDHYFVKQSNGSWASWIDKIDRNKIAIAKDAKVCYAALMRLSVCSISGDRFA